eukprot:c2765_g1_i1.p1 GENE.c2765_g1_i1~~c2765_g1_i1.p1  ORF type:complete len:133 (+),score=4.47 c2765_g1_i1:45-443(+)
MPAYPWVPKFLVVPYPLAPWAQNMILQSVLLLVISTIVCSFQSEFQSFYSAILFFLYFVLEYPVSAVVNPLKPWHNYLLRAIFYIGTSIPTFVEPTVAILAGIPATLGGLIYLWAWALGEHYEIPKATRSTE